MEKAFNAELSQRIGLMLMTSYSQGQTLTPEQLWTIAGGTEEYGNLFGNPQSGSSQAMFALQVLTRTFTSQAQQAEEQGSVAQAKLFQDLAMLCWRASIVTSPARDLLDRINNGDD